jgi:hypothetical protein
MQAAAAVTVLSTVVLASCGNSGSGGATEEPVATGSPDASADTAGARVRACTIVAVEEVEDLVGSPVTAGPTPSDAGAGCEWTAEVVNEETGSRASHLVELLVRDPGTALDQALTIEGATTPVAGLGDEALVETSTASFPAVMAGYRDADRVVTLLYQVQAEGTVDTDPRTRKDAVVEVLRSLQEKIAAST